MIRQGSLLHVVDNTGALTALCIKVLTKTSSTPGYQGDKIIVVVKTIIPEKKAVRGRLYEALIVRGSRKVRRPNGTYIGFNKPACILLRKDGTPLGSRIRGPVCKELRESKYVRIISLAALTL